MPELRRAIAIPAIWLDDCGFEITDSSPMTAGGAKPFCTRPHRLLVNDRVERLGEHSPRKVKRRGNGQIRSASATVGRLRFTQTARQQPAQLECHFGMFAG